MDIKEMQGVVDSWIREVGKGYFSELTNMTVLTEEVGELARVMARLYGDQRPKDSDLPERLRAALHDAPLEERRDAMREKLGEELADVLWVLVCLANQTGIDLSVAFRRTLEKKTSRDSARFQ